MKRTATLANRIEFNLPAEDHLEDASYVTFVFEVRYAVHPGREVSILDWALWECAAWIGDVSSPVPLGNDMFEAAACDRFVAWMRSPAHMLALETKCIEVWDTGQQVARERWG